MRIAPLSKVALVVVGLACEGGPIAPAASMPVEVTQSSATFVSGDRIEVDVRLQGCFHNDRIIASLRIDGDSAIVEYFKGTGRLGPGYRFQPVASLSADQLAGLTALLADYRRPAKGMCTSSERGRVTVTRDGEATRIQEFDDSSCRWFGREVPAFHWFALVDIVKTTDAGG